MPDLTFSLDLECHSTKEIVLFLFFVINRLAEPGVGSKSSLKMRAKNVMYLCPNHKKCQNSLHTLLIVLMPFQEGHTE